MSILNANKAIRTGLGAASKALAKEGRRAQSLSGVVDKADPLKKSWQAFGSEVTNKSTGVNYLKEMRRQLKAEGK